MTDKSGIYKLLQSVSSKDTHYSTPVTPSHWFFSVTRAGGRPRGDQAPVPLGLGSYHPDRLRSCKDDLGPLSGGPCQSLHHAHNQLLSQLPRQQPTQTCLGICGNQGKVQFPCLWQKHSLSSTEQNVTLQFGFIDRTNTSEEEKQEVRQRPDEPMPTALAPNPTWVWETKLSYTSVWSVIISSYFYLSMQ